MTDIDADPKLTNAKGAPQRIWFRVEQVEINWLPVGESAFLLWVLVLLLAVWLGIGAALGLVW
jgi:hypothetical protein